MDELRQKLDEACEQAVLLNEDGAYQLLVDELAAAMDRADIDGPDESDGEGEEESASP